MPSPSHPTKRTAAAEVGRHCLRYGALLIGAFVLLNTVVLDTFHIPTGSMAPALRGHHRVCGCPRCGQEVVVGRASTDTDGKGASRHYRKAFCQNCGLYPIPLADTLEVAGDKIMVNKIAYVVRSPARWEIVVFRLLGTFYIKRLLGLPTEDILIHDGDLYVNGQLIRKTFEQAKAMRVLVFDQDCTPTKGWRNRWEFLPSPLGSGKLILDGRLTPQALTYRHLLSGADKCESIRDEHAYNGAVHDESECVHDFMIETDIEVVAGQGSLALRLCDGHSWVEILLPVSDKRAAEVFTWSMAAPEQMRKLADIERIAPLQSGRRHHIEMALVDRRLSVVVDGHVWPHVDLPEAKTREGVSRPFQAQADGVRVQLHGFRLYRDVHYGQQGKNAVRGNSVRLGVDQYFVLGDNSPNSSDSRYWPDEGRVPAQCLIGSVLLMHRSRAEGAGLRWLSW